MSLLFRALSKAARDKEKGKPAPKLLATAADKEEKKHRVGAALRRGTLAALMVVTAAVAGGVFLWPEIETKIAPLMASIRASPPPPRPAPGPAPEARPAAPQVAQAELRRQQEEQRLAEEKRLAEEEVKRQAEAARLAAERRRAIEAEVAARRAREELALIAKAEEQARTEQEALRLAQELATQQAVEAEEKAREAEKAAKAAMEELRRQIAAQNKIIVRLSKAGPTTADAPAPVSAQPGAAESAQTLESVVDEVASTVSGLIAPEETPPAPADGPVNVDALVAGHEAARTPKAGREPIRIERSQGRPSSDVSRMVTVVNESDDVRDRHAAARRALGAGQTEGALKIYEDLLGRYPNNRLTLLGKANALHRLGRVGDAIRVYEQTLSRYPDEMAALTNLLGLIGRQSPQNALGRLRRLYRVNPGFGPVAAQMALIHAQLGDHGNALRYMKEALALAPRNPVYQVNVAIMSDRAGDKREAVRAYERTLELIAADTTALPISPPAIRDRLRYLRAN
ncbi:MAG: tetratricopeptide repeat protein [Proteobacteria bacterium]|nr:tetratricopeptide repeat protein [Pseudomonadota bacterium]